MKRVLLFIAVLALASCSKDSNKNETAAGKPIKIIPTVNSRASDTEFENFDVIGVTIILEDETEHTNNHQMIYMNHSFSASGDLRWYDGELTAEFTAYYPYEDFTPEHFTVREYQNSGKSYTLSDFMWARESDVVPSEDGIAVQFDHAMSQLVLIIDNENDTDIESIVISGAYGTAEIDMEELNIGPRTFAPKIDIKPAVYNKNDGVYRAILVPQTAGLTVTITDSDTKVFTYTLKETEFVSGLRYTASLTMEEPTDYTQIPVESDASINNWLDGGAIGEEEEEE